MRVRGSSTLNLWPSMAVCLALTACAMKPVETPPVASRDNDCATGNPLHMVSSEPARGVDPETESVLKQQPGDRRLAQINRRLYQSLRALDDELFRERSAAACKQPTLENSPLEAQSVAGSGPAPAAPNPQSSLVSLGAVANSPLQSGSARKATVSPGAAGGNGAVAPKIVAGSDNEIIARRLRKAAEEEKDPTLRAKLWKEYKEYLATAAVK